MGLFKKEKVDTNDILISTTDYLPNRQYEVIGLVTVSIGKLNTDYKYVAEEIKKEAVKLNADAIIGFRASLFNLALNQISQSAYGTAIRFTDKTED